MTERQVQRGDHVHFGLRTGRVLRIERRRGITFAIVQSDQLHPGDGHFPHAVPVSNCRLVEAGELARLVRKARDMNHVRISGVLLHFYCPVNAQALQRAYENTRTLPHMFEVHHRAWEKGTDVKTVTDALRRHLEDAETDGDDCTKLAVRL